MQVDFLFIPGGPGIGRRGDFTNFRIGGGTGRMEKGAVRIPVVQPDFLIRRFGCDDYFFLVFRMVKLITRPFMDVPLDRKSVV